MAYYDDLDDENQDPNAQQSAVQASPQSAQVSGGQPTQAQTPKGDNPGNFVGIQQYIDANKANSQRLANQVGGLVNNQTEKAKTAIQTGQNEFNNRVNQNQINYNENLFNEVGQNAAQVAKDQAKKNDVIKQRTAEYKGPLDLQAEHDLYTPISQNIQTAKQYGDLTQSEGGRRNLLTQIQKNKRADSGITSLNNALLLGDQAKGILNQSKQATTQLDAINATAQEQAKQNALNAQQTTAKTKELANASLQKTLQDFQKSITDRASSAEKYAGVDQGYVKKVLGGKSDAAQQDYEAALNDAFQKQLVGKNTVTNGLYDQQLANMGVNADQYADLIAKRDALKNQYQTTDFDDLTKYLSSKELSNGDAIIRENVPQEVINRNTIAGDEDFARQSALAELIGQNQNFIKDEGRRANLDTYDFDLTKALADINAYRKSQEDAKAAEAEKAKYKYLLGNEVMYEGNLPRGNYTDDYLMNTPEVRDRIERDRANSRYYT